MTPELPHDNLRERQEKPRHFTPALSPPSCPPAPSVISAAPPLSFPPAVSGNPSFPLFICLDSRQKLREWHQNCPTTTCGNGKKNRVISRPPFPPSFPPAPLSFPPPPLCHSRRQLAGIHPSLFSSAWIPDKNFGNDTRTAPRQPAGTARKTANEREAVNLFPSEVYSLPKYRLTLPWERLFVPILHYSSKNPYG